MTPTDATTPDEALPDAPLRAALRHAPDAGMGAPPELGHMILQRARTAVQATARVVHPAPTPLQPPARTGTRRTGWSVVRAALQTAWDQLSRPPVAAAMASVMVATTLGLMWRDGLMDEPFEPPTPPAMQSPAPATVADGVAPGGIGPDTEAARRQPPATPAAATAPAATEPARASATERPRPAPVPAPPAVADPQREAPAAPAAESARARAEPLASATGAAVAPPPSPAPAAPAAPATAARPPTAQAPTGLMAPGPSEAAETSAPPAPQAKAAADALAERGAEAAAPPGNRDNAAANAAAPAAAPLRLAMASAALPGPVLATLPAQLLAESPRWTLQRDGAEARPVDDATIAWLRRVAVETTAAGTGWEAIASPSDERRDAQVSLLRDGQLRHRFSLDGNALTWERPGAGPVQRLALPPEALRRLTDALPAR